MPFDKAFELADWPAVVAQLAELDRADSHYLNFYRRHSERMALS